MMKFGRIKRRHDSATPTNIANDTGKDSFLLQHENLERVRKKVCSSLQDLSSMCTNKDVKKHIQETCMHIKLNPIHGREVCFDVLNEVLAILNENKPVVETSAAAPPITAVEKPQKKAKASKDVKHG